MKISRCEGQLGSMSSWSTSTGRRTLDADGLAFINIDLPWPQYNPDRVNIIFISM